MCSTEGKKCTGLDIDISLSPIEISQLEIFKLKVANVNEFY